MKITLLAVGKTQTPYVLTGFDEYVKRLKRYITFEFQTIPDLKNTRGLTERQQKEKEGSLLLEALQPSDRVALLDEKGSEFTSREFSACLQREMLGGAKRLVFVIGGPYGFSEAVYDRADFKVSFSKMTFSHEMIRLFFVEQVYRAMTILKNEPYHHD